MAEERPKVDVEHVAELAHLALTDEEKAVYAQQLAKILEYAEQVLVLDTAGVPPTSHLPARQPSDRPDEVRPSLERDRALANAPDAAAGLFRVPRVIKEQ